MKMFRSEFDQYAKDYEKQLDHKLRRIVDPENKYFIEIKCEVLFKLISNYSQMFSKKMKILDIGCGLGEFDSILQKKYNLSAIGLDLSYEMLRVASGLDRNKKIELINADCLSLPFKESTFDLVFSSCVFHHLTKIRHQEYILEAKRICKKDGILVFFEHNPFNILTQIVVKTTPIDKAAKLITLPYIKQLCQNNGLTLHQQGYLLFGPKSIDQIISNKFPFINKLPLGGQYFISFRKDGDY